MNQKHVIDISMDLSENTVVWPADPKPKLTPILRQPQDPVNFTWLDFGAHAGTHVDAPYFLYSEKWTADQIPLDRLMGRCQVIDLTFVEETITAKAFDGTSITESRVLLKTKNSYDSLEEYNPFHIDMTVEAAQYLVECGVKTLGYDYLSFEREGRNDVHKVFLSRDVIVIDNLRLAKASPGPFDLLCLPIKLIGTDGAPARALLMVDENEQ